MGVSWQLSRYEPTEENVSEDLTAKASKHRVRDKWRAITHGDEFGFQSEGVFIRYGSLLP